MTVKTCISCKFFKPTPYGKGFGRCLLTGAMVSEDLPACSKFKEAGSNE